ncbi:GNAT family N-acetyltransferase [Pontibacter kalidii]|uniref:GNAT family N-acetyltransferase n=1 Tax=Pontibacter kalidii TaxID=2592049 RepID=UPI00224EDDC8|nr:GNAT family N-acetyltransferase [Pontibacter kalidii]
MTNIVRTNSEDPDFRALVTLLDQDLAVRDGAEHTFYAQYNKLDKIQQVVVAYREGMAVGCGAIKAYDETGIAEVKRMYVQEASRGQGIAMQVLQELEKWAAELKYTSCILETGKKQPEAIRLYQKCGYTLIPNYGQYKGIENSVCMQKQLTQV